jgi:Asp-tRNA(Asn)/Glu-tRNA(Gln) amidotransferase C subunit
VSHAWREDRAEPDGLCRAEEMLNNAPEREGPFFKVKKIIE